jgi:DNA polymerase III delta subunit
MLQILLGADDFSKKQFIDSLVEKQGADLVVFRQGEELPSFSTLLQSDLFSKAKVFWFYECMPDLSVGLEGLKNSTNKVVITLKSLDKRKKENNLILSNPLITVKEFVLPSGPELLVWIENRVKNLGGQIEKSAVKLLAFGFEGLNVGGFGYVPDYSLWQVDLEIQKLLIYAEGRIVSQEMVENLAVNESEINVFKISDAIASKNFTLAEKLISNFLASKNSVDVKGGILQLSAILAEQFRNILAVQNLQKLGKSPEEIAKIAGWKNSSRVSVMSRMASGFTTEKIKSFLQKLSLLDLEMKVSTSPPRVVFDLVLSQLVM